MTEGKDIDAVEVLIRGRVQGVFFRSWTEEEATSRGLSGWVRNNPDGTVSALFVGPRAMVEEMVDACRQGPVAARVDSVETSRLQPPEDLRGFRAVR